MRKIDAVPAALMQCTVSAVLLYSILCDVYEALSIKGRSNTAHGPAAEYSGGRWVRLCDSRRDILMYIFKNFE